MVSRLNFRIVWSILISLSLLPESSPAQPTALSAVESRISRFRIDHPESSLAFGFLEGEKSRELYFADQTGGQQPDTATVFRLGRLTALWTTTMLVSCSQQGLLSLDAPVSDYLPVNVPSPVYQRLVCQPVKRTEQTPSLDDPRFTPYACLPDPSDKPQPILLCYLSTHTSGLPDQPFTLERKNGVPDYPGFTVGSLYKFLSIYRIEQPIGFDYVHSDLGMVLLGHVIQRKTGQTLDSVFRQEVALPLGLASSRLLTGTEPGEYGLYAAAIGGEASFADLLRYLRFNLHPAGKIGQVMEYMHTPRVRIREHEEIALGWHCRTFEGNGRRVLYMNGSESGQTVMMVLEESGKSGFVLAGTGNGLAELGDQLLSLLYSKPE